MIRRLVRALRSQDWLGLGVELALVVVGILLAFQLDRAYQGSQDRGLEQRYLARLAADLRRDSAEIAQNVTRTETRLEQIELLESVVRDPTLAAVDPSALVQALEKVTWRSVPTITAATFDELQSTGRSVLLRSETLRGDLAEYYGAMEEQRRLGLGEDDQDRFRIETLGLLSGDRLSAIEDPDQFVLEVSPEEGVRLAEAFGSRPGAHLWLGRLTKYQVLMQRLSRGFQVRNRNLLAQIDSLTKGQ